MITKYDLFENDDNDFSTRGKWIYYKLCNLTGTLSFRIALDKLDDKFIKEFEEFYELSDLSFIYKKPMDIYLLFNTGNEIPGRIRCQTYTNRIF